MVLPCPKPLTLPAQQNKLWFCIYSGNQEMQRLNYLLYMDDIKLYAATNNQLQELLVLTQIFQGTLKSIWDCKVQNIIYCKVGN